MRYEDSPYETPEIIGLLEQHGYQGCRVLVEGKQTGVARVKVAVTHPAHDLLDYAAVDLTVIANLLLEPQDVYVLPDTAIIYTVLHIKQGNLHPIPLQPSHYYLQVCGCVLFCMVESGMCA